MAVSRCKVRSSGVSRTGSIGGGCVSIRCRPVDYRSQPECAVRNREFSRGSMNKRDEWRNRPDHDDPDASPWPMLALVILLELVCLILIARFALAVIAG